MNGEKTYMGRMSFYFCHFLQRTLLGVSNELAGQVADYFLAGSSIPQQNIFGLPWKERIKNFRDKSYLHHVSPWATQVSLPLVEVTHVFSMEYFLRVSCIVLNRS